MRAAAGSYTFNAEKRHFLPLPGMEAGNGGTGKTARPRPGVPLLLLLRVQVDAPGGGNGSNPSGSLPTPPATPRQRSELCGKQPFL